MKKALVYLCVLSFVALVGQLAGCEEKTKEEAKEEKTEKQADEPKAEEKQAESPEGEAKAGEEKAGEEKTGEEKAKSEDCDSGEEEHVHKEGEEEMAPALDPELANAPLDVKEGELTGIEKVDVNELLANPDKYNGKTVAVAGKIVDMCTHRHGWFGIESADGSRVIRIKTLPKFAVPVNAVGSQGVAEGTIEIATYTPEQAKHFIEDHKFITAEEAASGKDVVQAVMVANGASFERK